MGKIALLFAGQGAQKPGMGQSLAETSAKAAEVFRMADGLRPGTSEQCFKGTAEELSETVNTQPCIFTVDLAAAEALAEAGIVPDCVAGFSLGEIPALAFSGMLSPEEAFRFVMRRGYWMQEAGRMNPGVMFAVINLSPEQVEAVCQSIAGSYPVNYNAPGQISVSCVAEAADAFAPAVAQAGGKALRLKVSGGFHSPMMQPAYEALRGEFAGLRFASPDLPVYSNLSGHIYESEDQLFKQIISPVRWEELIRAMADTGVDTFIEVGPGKTLTGLVKKILPQALALNVEDNAGLDAAKLAVR